MGAAIPDTHARALRWLDEQGGEGVLDRYGALIAGGKRYKGTGAAQTWLRLFTSGHVETAGRNRIRLNDLGRAIVGSKGHPVNPDQFTGARNRAPTLDEAEA